MHALSYAWLPVRVSTPMLTSNAVVPEYSKKACIYLIAANVLLFLIYNWLIKVHSVKGFAGGNKYSDDARCTYLYLRCQ